MRPRTGALSLDARVLLRQLGSQPGVLLTILLATVIGSFLIASSPRSLEQAATEDLRATVVQPPPAMRNISVELRNRIASGPVDDPMRNVRNVGNHFAETHFPDSVKAIISSGYSVVDTGRFQILPLFGEEAPHPYPMFLRFRLQEGIFDHLDVVAGARPEAQEAVPVLIGTECPADPDERADLTTRLDSSDIPGQAVGDCRLEQLPHLQVLVSEATREALGVKLNQPMMLSPDRLDPFYFGLDFQQLEFGLVMSISGIVELDDLSGEYWFGDGSVHAPRIRQTADLRVIYATGLTVPEEFSRIIGAVGQIERGHTWRYQVEPDLVAAAEPARLEADLESVQSEFSGAGHFRAPVVVTRLPDLLEIHQRQRDQTIAVLSVQVVGLIALVVSLLVLLSLLMTQRQQKSIVLARGRGASRGQLGLTRLYQALLLIVPPSIVGYAIAAWVNPGTEGLASYRATVGLVGIGVIAALLTVVPAVRRPLGELLIGERTRRPASPPSSRVVVELTVLALATGGVVLLRRRGALPSAAEPGSQVDLLLAVTPVLVAVSAGVVLLRVYPGVVGAMAWLGARSRGLIGLVGVRRIYQQVFVERLPILVIVLCVGTAVFSMLARTTITSGQVATSWHTVAADYRVTNFSRYVPLPSSVTLDELPLVEDLALAIAVDDARAIADFASARTTLLAVDADAYEDVTEGKVGAPSLPDGFSSAGEPVGTVDAPIPVIVSQFWPGGLDLAVGDVFVVDLGRLEPNVVVAEIRQRYPDVQEDGPFVVMDLGLLESFSDVPLQPTLAYVRAPESAGSDLMQTLAGQSSLAVITSRYEVLDALTEDPFVSWATKTTGMVFLFGMGLAGMTAVSALALGSASRSRDFAYLQTMGMVRRQALAMTVIEQLPSLALATLVGVLTGLASAWMLEPTIDLTPFTGSALPMVIQIDWIALASASMALLLAVSAGIVIFLVAFRERELTRTLRVGDEL